MNHHLFCMLVFSLAAVACEAQEAAQVGEAYTTEPTEAEIAGLETLEAASVDAGAYHVRPGDVISVRVYGENDLNVNQRIDFRGQIRLPLLENVDVAGLQVREIETRLETLFRERGFLRKPQVTASVVRYAPAEVLLFGEITRKGPLQLPAGKEWIDIVDLIARAGDFTGIANSDRVQIKRVHADGTVEIKIVDVESIIKDRDRGINVNSFKVLPGDVIYVPARLF